MESSEEIRRVVDRWLVGMTEGDVDAVLLRMSEDPAALSIGTDPAEWWHGRETHALWRRQFEESGALPYVWDEIEAWEEGTVGWAALKVTVSLDEHSVVARGTCVLHLEHGEWKILQAHLSLPQPNEDVFGERVTVTLEQLEETIQRERPELSGNLAADGTITIVFTDIVDSTVLNARLGDDAWLDILRRHNAIIEEATTMHGGRVVKTQGDGSMLAFSSARRAVACSKDIQTEITRVFADTSPPVRVRIGVHTGEALREDEDFFGITVNYAARVAGHALGGEVLVSNLVHELVMGGGPGMDFMPSREVELKGLEGPHRLFAIDLS